jgi:hypothetical protein
MAALPLQATPVRAQFPYSWVKMASVPRLAGGAPRLPVPTPPAPGLPSAGRDTTMAAVQAQQVLNVPPRTTHPLPKIHLLK